MTRRTRKTLMNDETVELVCRFCLESGKNEQNPLLEPCECKGSIQYVHLVCLNRWRFQNPERNKDICQLCHTIYRLAIPDELEVIPGHHIFFVNLDHPILTSAVIHYMYGLMRFTMNVPTSYLEFQIVNHCLLVTQMAFRWRVVNHSRYIQYWMEETRIFIFLFHFLILTAGLFGSTTLALLVSSILVPLYWKFHKEILRAINDEYEQRNQ